MEKLFLLDAYALIYRSYYALIKAPRINSKGMNTSAILGFVNTLQEILTKENPSHIGVAFDPSGPTFRHEMYKPYKAQREETPEAIRQSVPIIKSIIEAYRIPILEVAGYEADDVIGTLATQASQQGIIETYMMTPDKDYGQLVKENVFMYRPKSMGKDFEVLGIPEIKAKYGIDSPAQVIDMLGLMGDASDNIPGCPGVGEKTACKLIQQFGSVENLLAHTTELKGALKEKVEANREQITLSKFLATIKIDVPITLDMKKLAREEMDADALKKIFDELEFRNLAERILGIAPSKAEKKEPLQGNLFAEFAPEGTETPENQNLTRLKDIEHDYQLIDTEEKTEKLVEFLLSKKILSLDTETTSTDPISAELVGMSFSVDVNQAFYVPVPQNFEEAKRIAQKFKRVYEDKQILKVGQNIKYDILVLKNYGIEVAGQMFDTMVAHYILSPELRHGMDYMAETILKYSTIKIEELIGKGRQQKKMSDLSPTLVYEYACEDADVTLKLKNVLEKRLEEVKLTQLFTDIEMPLVPVLAYMERNGVRIDTDALQEVSKIYTERMRTLEEEVHQMAGEAFNISSPRQVGNILFEKMKIVERPKKTKSGQYVTSEDVLEKLRHKSPMVEKILDYRGYKKLLSTYIDALPKLVNPKTEHIHSSFNQTITSTGRLSSSNPNLQNIPVRSENGRDIRKAFIPDEGCEFFSADYSQIELRIMAHLSQDANMIEAFKHGQDIHAATAAKIYKKSIDEVSKQERSKAKTANFGIIYGITFFGLAERMNVDRNEAKELISGYFQTYPQVKEYMDRSIDVAREKGYTETIFGRRCYLPDINSHNSVVRGYAERNAINAPIQGSAADIIKVAMVRIWRRFEAEGIRSKMILQVHDELNFSVFPEEKELVQQIVIEEMEHAYAMRVPLIADCGWGKNWLEAH